MLYILQTHGALVEAKLLALFRTYLTTIVVATEEKSFSSICLAISTMELYNLQAVTCMGLVNSAATMQQACIKSWPPMKGDDLLF